MSTKSRAGIFLAIILTVLLCLGSAALVGSRLYRYGLRGAPTTLVWDFSRKPDTSLHGRPAHSISCVSWPASNRGSVFTLQGQFDLTIHGGIRAPGATPSEFHEIAQTIFVNREGDAITSYVVHFDEGIPADQACQKAKDILEKWSGGIGKTRGGSIYPTVDDWLNEIKKGKSVPEDQYHIRGLHGGWIIITVQGDPKLGAKRPCTLTLLPGG